MDNLRLFLALAALISMALFYTRLGVRSALAPLCAVATVCLGLALFGALGALRLGGWALYLFAACCAIFLLWEWLVKKRRPAAPGVGFCFFVVGSLIFVFLLWMKQPLFTEWDEFSLWGTASKLMKLNDELYTTAPVGWGWTATQKPAYLVIGYFFQFFGTDFAEWQTYVACDVFQLALLASLFAPFDGSLRKNWPVVLPLAMFSLLVPYLFQHYQQVNAVSPVYLDTLADIPLGLCFAAVFACWYGADKARSVTFMLRRKKGDASVFRTDNPLSMLPVVAALALLTMTKDTGFALALVAVVIMAGDWFFTRPKTVGIKAKIGGTALRLGIGLSAVLVPFLAWEKYTTTLTGQSRVDSAATEGGVGILEAPFAFFAELVSPDKRPVFTEVVNGMTRFLFTARGNMLGTGVVIAVLCLLLVALAAYLYKDAAHRRRCASFAVLSTLGFLPYYFLIALTYLYIMRETQAWAFESYERYVYPYYIGWLLGSVVLLCVAIANSKMRRVTLGKAAVLGLAAVAMLRVGQLVPAQYTVLGVHPDEYNARRAFNAKADALRPLMTADDRTFLVISGDVGIGWFMYCHQLLPLQIDYSYGGGTLETRTRQPDGTTLLHEVTPDEWRDYLEESGCTQVIVENADLEFAEKYGEVFNDGMLAYQNGETRLYRIAYMDNVLTLIPTPENAQESSFNQEEQIS